MVNPKTAKLELIVLVSFPKKHSAFDAAVSERVAELLLVPVEQVAAPADPAIIKHRPADIAVNDNLIFEILICSPPILSE